jgi:ABC-type branched-subunit amino acid transport system substrate-binding protein
VLADAAYNQKGWREVAFIREETDYALGVYESFTNRFKDLSGTVIDSTFAPETTDFRTQLSKLENQDPDALFVDVQAAPSANRILTQTKELNWQPPVLLTNSIAPDTELLSNHSEILEGGLATVLEVDNTNDQFQNLKTAYQDEYGSDLPYPSFSQVMWDTVKLTAAGMRAVSTDGEALSSWVRNQNDFVGASGPISINNDGDRVGAQTLKVIRGGKLEDAGK